MISCTIQCFQNALDYFATAVSFFFNHVFNVSFRYSYSIKLEHVKIQQNPKEDISNYLFNIGVLEIRNICLLS
jgi:hypothetical protein